MWWNTFARLRRFFCARAVSCYITQDSLKQSSVCADNLRCVCVCLYVCLCTIAWSLWGDNPGSVFVCMLVQLCVCLSCMWSYGWQLTYICLALNSKTNASPPGVCVFVCVCMRACARMYVCALYVFLSLPLQLSFSWVFPRYKHRQFERERMCVCLVHCRCA